MKLVDYLLNKYLEAGIQASLGTEGISIPSQSGAFSTIKIGNEWEEAFSRIQINPNKFDTSRRSYVSDLNVEMELAPVGINFFVAEGIDHEFQGRDGSVVKISSPSIDFIMAQTAGDRFIDHLKRKADYDYKKHAYQRNVKNEFNSVYITAKYIHPNALSHEDLLRIANSKIKSCLVKIAVEDGQCFTTNRLSINRRSRHFAHHKKTANIIPACSYNETVSNYYKIAKSSPFPSQSYLAYYHVLEYFFLKVSEQVIHEKLSVEINSPSFTSSDDFLETIVSIVRGQDSRNDENELLRKVISKFVSEKDLSDFIKQAEANFNEKIYTKNRKLFGEEMHISASHDQVLAQTARILKHIRNAIVHSSDRHRRDERHSPLSQSELIILDFIPIISFIAEKTIIGSAEAFD